MTAAELRDMRCALRFDQLHDAGRNRADILAVLDLTEQDARSLAERIRMSAQRARVDIEPTIIGRVLPIIGEGAP